MSLVAMIAVARAVLPGDLPCNRHRAKLVLLALANRADENGMNAWPSVTTMAIEAMCSRKTVEKILKALQASGFISEQAPPRQRRPRTWMVDIEAITTLMETGDMQLGRESNGTDLNTPARHSISTDLEALARESISTGLSIADLLDRQTAHPDRQNQHASTVLSEVSSVPHGVPTNSPLEQSFLNSHLNEHACSENQKDKSFESAKVIAKKHLEATNYSKSVATVNAMEEASALNINADTIIRAIEHHASLHRMRAKFRSSLNRRPS